LVYKTAALLAELVHPSNPAHAGFHQVPSQIFNLLNYLPKRIKDIAMRFITGGIRRRQSASLQEALSLALEQYRRMAMLFYCAAIIVSAAWWIGCFIFVPQQQNTLIY
jgi:cobalamin biosynthesis protein CobD/CbiB